MKPRIQYLLNIKLTKIHNSHHLQPSTSQHPSLKQRETRNIRKWKQLPSQNDKEKDLLWWQFFSWRISKEKEKGTFTLKIWEGMKSRRRDEPDPVHRTWLTYPSLTTLSPLSTPLLLTLFIGLLKSCWLHQHWTLCWSITPFLNYTSQWLPYCELTKPP